MQAVANLPFGRVRGYASAYRQIGVETSVSGASPHHLVTLLFDGFVDAVVRARGAMQQRNLQVKAHAINHAVRIIEEGLKPSLDLAGGGKLAQDLYDLYVYISLTLTKANLENDDKALERCQRLIEPVREGWKGIGPQVHAAGA